MTDTQPDARTEMYANAINDAAWYVDGADRAATAAIALADAEQEALRRECLDREATEQDVRARLADAENTLARVRAFVATAPVMQHSNGYPVQAVPKADLLAALDGTS